jgi:tetratricopeptide (TPR) repeat protein
MPERPRFIKFYFGALACLLIARCGYGAPPVSLETIVDRYIAARGGLPALQAITSLTFTADFGNGHTRRMIKMRPYYFLVGCTEPTCAIAEGFDGSAWEMYPGKQRVIRARLEAAKSLRRASEFDEPLIGWREKGHTAELKRVEEFQGQEAYRIDMVLSDGLVGSYYIDPESFLMVGSHVRVPMHARGEHFETINLYEDYRPVANVLYPFRIRTLDARTGKVISGEHGWDKIEANLPYDRAMFTPPPVYPAPITALAEYLLAISGSVSPSEQWFRAYTGFRADAANSAIDSSDDLNWLGYELLKQNAFDDALLVFRTVVNENPSSAAAYDSLGDGLYLAGRQAEALLAFRKSLDLNPGSESVRSKVKELQDTGRLSPRY